MNNSDIISSVSKGPALHNKEGKLDQFEKRIRFLEKEVDKLKEKGYARQAWQKSWVRILATGFLAYFAAALYLWFMNERDPFIRAATPVVVFLVSAVSVPFLKWKWWKPIERDVRDPRS